jgi:ABC-2 type transport system permease protein
VAKLFAFVGAYMRTNMATALEYRASLVMQVAGMFVTDTLWVIFWGLYFTKFPVLKGWTFDDVMVLWAAFAMSAGIVMGLFSNALRIPELVVQGQLDYYLSLPKDVLLHLLVSRISTVSFGDLIFGPVLLVVMVHLTWLRMLIFLACVLLSAVVMLSFFVLAGSLTFFLGNSTTLSGQLNMALVHFSSYPAPIFQGAVKVVLFSLIPAGFITTLPVELVRAFSWSGFLTLVAGAALFLGLAIWVFGRGLKRYESGNLMQMRS